MRRSLLALCAAAVLTASACGSTHQTAAPPITPVATAPLPARTTTRPRPPTSPPSTDPATTTVAPTTTTIPDTSVVPHHITVAYVDAVLAELNHVYGDAVRSTVAHKRLTVSAYKDLAAIYTPSLAAEEQKIFIQTVSGNGLKAARRHPGDPITHVIRIVHSSSSCVYGRVFTNTDPETVHPINPPADEYIGLERHSASRGLNKTAWVIFFDGVNKTPTTIPNQCPRS